MSDTPVGFRVPVPRHRPGQLVDFSYLDIPEPGFTRKPAINTPASEMQDLAFGLVRVLDSAGRALGPWNPELDGETLRRGLRAMSMTRAFDDRMFRAQRQGKTSFYIRATGEEAIACAQSMALRADDMCFTTYRMQGILITRGYPISAMMHQIFSNALDPLKGRQLPTLYSARDYSFFSLSGNVGTQYCQAVGWAMASAYAGDSRIAAGWIGEGSTAEGDFHYALTFASVYRAPVVLSIVNNQWAISSFQGIAGGDETTFAAKAIAYGLPSLRVDGNDFLAVYAATQWATDRARANLGAVVLELYTYRAENHSTSDDASAYRPVEEPKHWPLGDPIDRLKRHLIESGEWSEELHIEMLKDIAAEVRSAAKEAEAVGTLGKSPPSPKEMFSEVFKAADWRLQQQRQKLGV